MGLILCAERDEVVARYSVLNEGKQLFASRYLTVLPTEAELAEAEEDDNRFMEEKPEPEPWFAEKLRLYFEVLRPEVTDVEVFSVWAAGELLQDFGGNFNLYIRTKDLTKQEGIIFRHLLRLILLCEEFAQATPPDTTEEEWQTFLRELANRLTASCRLVDPSSTEEIIQRAQSSDALQENLVPKVHVVPSSLSEVTTPEPTAPEDEFGAGVFGE